MKVCISLLLYLTDCQIYPSIPPNLQAWAMQQPLFIVSSAPLHGRHVNASPKGLASSTFTVFDESHCGYIDFTGSGNETISHIYERGNGRVTILLMSFDALPRILRFYCSVKPADVVELSEKPEWKAALARFGHERTPPGARAVIFLKVDRCVTSCGKSVPMLDPKGQARKDVNTVWKAGELQRDITEDGDRLLAGDVLVDRFSLWKWAQNMEGQDKLVGYRKTNNAESLDGLPGLKTAMDQKRWLGAISAGRRMLAEHWFVITVLLLWTLLLLWSSFGQSSRCRVLDDGQGRLATYCRVPTADDIRAGVRVFSPRNLTLPWISPTIRW